MIFASLLALWTPPAAAAPDWTLLGQETAAVLSAYLQTDTTNPPGNEDRGAALLADYLRADGISATIIEGEPGRANLIARLDSGHPGPALCLLSHIDVVPAEPGSWPADKGPLSGRIDEAGYVWGRGALDMKGMGAIELMTLRLLARERVPLLRDIVLVAVADEEVDNAGIQLVADRHWDKLNCGWVINEGGVGIQDLFMPGQAVYPISVAEKGVLWARIVATGEPGHGSTPVPDRAPARLQEALGRISAMSHPVEFQEPVLDLLGAVGAAQGGLTGAILKRPGLAKIAVRGRFLANPVTKAVVTDTVQVTGFGGANEPNVVPGAVWAQIDARILPGHTPEALLAQIRDLLPEPWYRVEVIDTHPAALSPYEADPLFAALVAESVAGKASAVAGPVISPGYTDSVYLRSKGVIAYGLVPFVVGAEELGTMHGNNERVSVANLTDGLRVLYNSVLRFAGDPNGPPPPALVPPKPTNPWGIEVAPPLSSPWGTPPPAPSSPWGI